jgi:hypothetical protein
MKNIYTGYCKKTPHEIIKMWDAGLITYDANVLLNLYRYSEETKKEILRLIEKLSSKNFLTYQAGLEFHKNRFEVISEQENAYKDFYNSLTKIEDELNTRSRHPFLSEKLQKKFSTTLSEVKEEIKGNEKYYGDLIVTDEIYNDIHRIFENKIENSFSDDVLIKIYEEGKKRYEKKIPPGFEDEKDKEANRQYGDLVIWKQIIIKAKETKKSIILITDERKKDWWWKLKNGKVIGPRQELVEEIYKEANVDFYIYSTERFLEYGLTYLKEKSNPKAVEEVKEHRAELLKVKEFEKKMKLLLAEREKAKEKQTYLRHNLDLLVFQKQHIKDRIAILLENENISESEKEELLILKSQHQKISIEAFKLQAEYHSTNQPDY